VLDPVERVALSPLVDPEVEFHVFLLHPGSRLIGRTLIGRVDPVESVKQNQVASVVFAEPVADCPFEVRFCLFHRVGLLF
jgi:hypothetical protein